MSKPVPGNKNIDQEVEEWIAKGFTYWSGDDIPRNLSGPIFRKAFELAAAMVALSAKYLEIRDQQSPYRNGTLRAKRSSGSD